MDYKRSERVGEQLRAEISDILLRKIKDPRVSGVSITAVEVSDDLRNAKVFVSIFNSASSQEEVLKGLKSAAGFIRTEVLHRLQIKRVPELLFKVDTSIEKGVHIMEILEDLKRKGEDL